jgi:phytoene synthase
MIDGVGSDLESREMRTFDELYEYCYKVASVVGLSIIHIFGFESPLALELAERCGIAFQLTNILRDVREDAERGRVYLPAEDLARFGVDPSRLEHDQRFVELMRFEAARARGYYDESWPLLDLVHRRSRPSLWALMRIYSRLLERIERSNYDVLDRRISLPVWEKLSIVGRALAQ